MIAFAAILAVAYARPQSSPSADAKILKYENDNIGVDGYQFAFETSDGVSRQETGTLENAGSDHEALSVHGSHSSRDERSGKSISVTYVADSNGFYPRVQIN